MKKLFELKEHLQPGQVYRRADLGKWSKSVDRDLQQLLKESFLEKLSGGVYYVPSQSSFGKSPAAEKDLVRTFLKDDRFVIISSNDYNGLGVGTTQLYNTRRVYNYKRHGTFKLGNRKFQFVRKPFVPDRITKEFLLVDLANNLKNLAEDQTTLVENVKKKATEMDANQLKLITENFGTIGTKKMLASTFDHI